LERRREWAKGRKGEEETGRIGDGEKRRREDGVSCPEIGLQKK